jgi:hypothetical protein
MNIRIFDKNLDQSSETLDQLPDKPIEAIIIPYVHRNIYHVTCDFLQILGYLCKNGKKLNCPIYTDTHPSAFSTLLSYFTDNEIRDIARFPGLQISSENTLLINVWWTRPLKYLPYARNMFRNSLPSPPSPPQKVLIIQRKNNRVIENIQELSDLIKNILNIDPIIYYPEDHSIEDQIATFHDTKILISAHGAAVTNSLFMQDKTHVIEVMSPELKHECYVRFIKELQSDINHIQIFHDMPPENAGNYPEDLQRVLSKHETNPEEKTIRSKYLRHVRDCAFQGFSFRVDKEKFKNTLIDIGNKQSDV